MKELELKYGCNPTQRPSRIYMSDDRELPIKVLSGRPGYINFLDAFNGWQLVSELKKATGLPVGSEIMYARHLPLFEDVDLIQVGARNMQNFELLKELGKITNPILLKRGLAATIEEWLMSAEYIMAGGNENVILCERGIRTYETAMRNTLDLSAIPMIKKKSHLPVMVDPSHATGIRDMVEPMALAAIAAGADGFMVEVHNDQA